MENELDLLYKTVLKVQEDISKLLDEYVLLGCALYSEKASSI